MMFKEVTEKLVGSELLLEITDEFGSVWRANKPLTLDDVHDLQQSGFTHVFTKDKTEFQFMSEKALRYICQEFKNFSTVIEVLLDSNHLRVLLEAIYVYDKVTFEHSVQVAKLMYRFASILAYNDTEIARLVLTGLLHDVGKCCIPKYILCSNSALSQSARKLIQNHPIYSGMLIAYRWDSVLAKTATQHHEQLDGSGYPLGINENLIMKGSSILSMCDVYQALRQKRPYKVAYSPELAYKILAETFSENFLLSRFHYIVCEDSLEENKEKKEEILLC